MSCNVMSCYVVSVMTAIFYMKLNDLCHVFIFLRANFFFRASPYEGHPPYLGILSSSFSTLRGRYYNYYANDFYQQQHQHCHLLHHQQHHRYRDLFPEQHRYFSERFHLPSHFPDVFNARVKNVSDDNHIFFCRHYNAGMKITIFLWASLNNLEKLFSETVRFLHCHNSSILWFFSIGSQHDTWNKIGSEGCIDAKGSRMVVTWRFGGRRRDNHCVGNTTSVS